MCASRKAHFEHQCLTLLLAARVAQVVEIDILAVTVDPGGDETETVEVGAGGLVSRA